MFELTLLVVSFAGLLFSLGYFLFYRKTAFNQFSENNDFDFEEAKPTLSKWQVLISQLGIQLSPLVFILGTISCGLSTGLLFNSFFPEQTTFSIAAAVIFLPVTWLTLKDLLAWRARRFENALYDIVTLMHAAAISGAPAILAFSKAAETAKGFVKVTLLEVIRNLNLGGTIDSATLNINAKYPSEGTRLFVNTLRTSWYSGGNFSASMGALSNILRERLKFRRTISGKLSGARYAAFAAAGFPYLLLPFLKWHEPDWLSPLTEHPQGPSLLLFALSCQVVGFIWIRKTLRSDF